MHLTPRIGAPGRLSYSSNVRPSKFGTAWALLAIRRAESRANVTHATLVAIGVRWLSRRSSTVFYEFAAVSKECPDIIGWADGFSTLIECKANLTLISVRTMQEQVSLSFSQERAVASLAGLFGIVALLLAAVGLYGVTAYSVAQRTNEIGLRMALGADRATVVRLVLRGASFRVLLGLIFGVPLAIGAGRLISAQLYGVSSWDPLALTVAAGTLAICAFFAAVIPARRAASISPMDALRTD